MVIDFFESYGLKNSWIAEKLGINNMSLSRYISNKRELPLEQCKLLYYFIVEYKERNNGIFAFCQK